MAKQPETQKHYRIHADNIPLEGLGGVLAALEECGVTNVGYEVVTDILAYKHKPAPRVFDVPSVDVARSFISLHHTFKARELITAFEQDSRSAALGYATIKKLVEMGELRKLEPGHYQSTKVAEASPSKIVPAAPVLESDSEPAKPNGKGRRYATSNIILISNAMSGRKTISRPEMVEILEANDRPKNSIDGIIGKLKNGGRLKSLGEGKYEVVKSKSAKDMRNG
jgi:hypothetical protein